MNNKVTITMIKNLLRDYRKRRWCFIWRDEVGVHIADMPWGQTYVGTVRWGRCKGEK